MKNYLLTITLMFAFIVGATAQTTYLDFEINVDPIGYDFGGNSHTFGIENPDKTGNVSEKVGQIVTGPEVWAGIAMPIGGSITFSAADNTFTMDVWSDVTGEVLLKLENAANTDQNVEVSGQYTTANSWETITYDFPDNLDAGVYTQFVLFFNFGTTEETTWYFDNLVGPNASFSDDVTVNLRVEDKLGIAESSVGLIIENEPITLTQDGNLWTAQKSLAPYTITQGGGDYEAVITVDDESIDTTTISVSGGAATMDWNYLILIEEPEDGTADAIATGGTPPTIDGEIDAIWDNAKFHPLQKRDWWGSPTGLYSYFKVMWDIDNVYILNYVDDATPLNTGGEPYENDNVELFFDMNQSATSPFDANDWQIRCIRGLDSYTGSANVTEAWGENVSRAQKELADNSGYVVEWAIPWTSLSSSFLPLATVEFNFDVAVADVADGVGRDYIIAWNTTQDINYQDTQLYGTITLSSKEVETSVNNIIEVPNLSMYPNPVVDQLNIQADQAIFEVEIFDITGRKSFILSNINEMSVSLNLEQLENNGMYIVKITDIQGNTSARKIMVK